MNLNHCSITNDTYKDYKNTNVQHIKKKPKTQKKTLLFQLLSILVYYPCTMHPSTESKQYLISMRLKANKIQNKNETKKKKSKLIEHTCNTGISRGKLNGAMIATGPSTHRA